MRTHDGEDDAADPIADDLTPAEAALADALGGLRPAAGGTSAYRVWYEAGVAAGAEAGRRRARAWRAVAAGAAAAAVALAAFPWVRPPAVVAVDRVVYVPSPGGTSPARPATALSPDVGGGDGGTGTGRLFAAADAPPGRSLTGAAEYLDLRDAVVRRGWDGLPPARGGSPPPDARRSQADAGDVGPFDVRAPFDPRG